MRESVKQRIVGAFVLVALAVILMPLLFDLEQPRVIDTSTAIPAAPDIEPVIIPEPAREPGMEPPKPAQQTFLPAQPDDRGGEPIEAEVAAPAAAPAVPESRPTLGDDQLLDAWVVQVGSYRDEGGAAELVERLKKAGYKAYSRAAVSAGAPVNRVFVGPVIVKDRAEEYKSQIDRAFGVKSLVLPFEP